jgi:flagellar motor switch protein FliN/FliY
MAFVPGPVGVCAPAGRGPNPPKAGGVRADNRWVMPADVQSLLALEVPVIVVLGERPMKLADVLRLAPGTIIELPKNAEAELALLVNNKEIGSGQAVKVGENFGIQLSSIGDVEARVRALGPATATASPSGGAPGKGEGPGGVGGRGGADPDEEAAKLAEAMLAGQV